MTWKGQPVPLISASHRKVHDGELDEDTSSRAVEDQECVFHFRSRIRDRLGLMSRGRRISFSETKEMAEEAKETKGKTMVSVNNQTMVCFEAGSW